MTARKPWSAANLTLIEKCPACFGSGKARGNGNGFMGCLRCDGTGRRARIDRIDPTGQDVFVLFGVKPK